MNPHTDKLTTDMGVDHRRPVTITLTPEELKTLVKQAFHEEMELLGMRAEGPEPREAMRKDMAFLRQMRQRIDGVASKVGYAFIMGVCALIASVFLYGIQAKFGR